MIDTLLAFLGLAGFVAMAEIPNWHCWRRTRRFNEYYDGRLVARSRRCIVCGQVIAGTCIAVGDQECGHKGHQL